MTQEQTTQRIIRNPRTSMVYRVLGIALILTGLAGFLLGRLM